MVQRNIKRTNIILLILLALQIILVVLVYRPAGERPQADGSALLQEFETALVAGFTITDNEGKTITLEKNPHGWSIISPAAEYPEPLPADNEKVKTLLGKISALARSRVVTRTPASHNRLKVGELYNRKIELIGADDHRWVLFLGSSPNYKSLHVRLDGEDEVYLDQELSIWEAPAAKESWWSTDYVAISPTDLTGVALTNANGSLHLTRNNREDWRLADMPADMEFNETALESFLNDISHLTILEYLPATFKNSEVSQDAKVTLTTSKGDTTLTIYPKDNEKEEHIVQSSTVSYAARAGIHAVKDFLEYQAGHLLHRKE